MNHFIVGILKTVVLGASCALLVLDRLLGVGPQARHEKQRRMAYVAIAAVALFGFTNFGNLRGGTFVHTWEQFHFYLGAKYQKEVGWFDLYKAVLIADRAAVGALSSARETRNLRTFELISVDQALLEAPRIRANFSDARWTAFIEDWRSLSRARVDWQAIIKDHGNSNSPAWAIFAHPIANLLPLEPWAQRLIGSLDIVLLGILAFFLYRTFGVRVAGVAAVIGLSAPLVFDYLAGSFLRWDWLFALGMATCFLHRGRYRTAGAFFGYAVATKLFPIFFGVALLFKAIFEVVSARRIPFKYVRFAIGSASALLVSVLISSAMFGTPRVWLEYKERIDAARVEKYYSIQYSLRTVFLQVAESSPAELAQGLIFPNEIKQARPDVDIGQHAAALLIVQLVFTALIAAMARRTDDVGAFTLGPLLVFTWLTVNMYYWNMLGLLALGLFRRPEKPAFYALLGLHLILALFYLYQHTNRGYAEGYFVAMLMAFGVLLFGVAEALELRKPREVIQLRQP